MIKSESRHGVCITGYQMYRFSEPVEGRLMALAARLDTVLPRGALCRTAVQVAKDVQEQKPEELYPCQALVIPNLQSGDTEGFGIEKSLQWNVLELLKARQARGLKTIVFAEMPDRLTTKIATFIEHFYDVFDISNDEPVQHEGATPPPDRE